ncbi:MAG: DUF2569 family protein [Burkholderiaceae bacterium]|nr:DUF2569 family protein [Burkholderiaceae bacterium]
MTRQWQTIGSQEAIQHHLYGVKGWPVVLSISIFLDLFRVLSPLADEASSAGMNLFQFFSLAYPEIVFAKILLTLNGAAALVIAWLLFTRHRKFRIASSALLVGCWPTAAGLSAALGVPELSEALAESFLPWFISSVIWVTYLQRSRRVRVTFEQCVLVGDVGGAVQLQ